jgi:hypothetical protein
MALTWDRAPQTTDRQINPRVGRHPRLEVAFPISPLPKLLKTAVRKTLKPNNTSP